LSRRGFTIFFSRPFPVPPPCPSSVLSAVLFPLYSQNLSPILFCLKGSTPRLGTYTACFFVSPPLFALLPWCCASLTFSLPGALLRRGHSFFPFGFFPGPETKRYLAPHCSSSFPSWVRFWVLTVSLFTPPVGSPTQVRFFGTFGFGETPLVNLCRWFH